MKLYQAFLWTMIGSLALAAALGVWALLMPQIGIVQEKILVTSILVGTFSLPAFGCAIVLHRRLDRPVMWLGIIAAAAALALWLVEVWTPRPIWRMPQPIYQTAATLTTLSLWAAHFGLLRLAKFTRPWPRHVRTATLVLAGALAVVIILAFWTEPRDDWFWRLLGILSILAVCGTIITPILALIAIVSGRSTRESLPSSIHINLTCPRCGSSTRVPAGVGRCASCGLRISIDIEEPRCACGYLLHKLQGENCPECGRAIPEADRWHVMKSSADAASAE